MKKVTYEITEENAIIFIKSLLSLIEEEKKEEDEKFLTIEELSDLIGYKKTSIYGLVQKDKIPYHKKGKLFFLKSEIITWLKEGKKSSPTAIQKKAEEYLFKNTII